MLKECHERNCDGEKTCAVVVISIPYAVCGKHEAVEEDKMNSDYLCATGMRLNNSEALVNLRRKLNHSLRNDAECLILSCSQILPHKLV